MVSLVSSLFFIGGKFESRTNWLHLFALPDSLCLLAIMFYEDISLYKKLDWPSA